LVWLSDGGSYFMDRSAELLHEMLSRMVQNLKTRALCKTRRSQPG
jgi:hypothetical protein